MTLRIHVKNLIIFKRCTKDFNPYSKFCKRCISYDICLFCLKGESELYRLPNIKPLDKFGVIE